MADGAGQAFDRLVQIMATLRGPDGCPWDREQTPASLTRFVLEETYEVLDAIDRGNHADLCEELGDFLFQAVFLAQLEYEAGRFSITDSLRAITEKLVRRHPHVFARDRGEPALDTADDVRVRWDAIKAQERGGQTAPRSLLGGVAPALPALLRAHTLGARAASVGFDWPHASDVMAKIREEVDELREVVEDGPQPDPGRAEEEMGDLLFAMANLARKLGIEPETALRKANDKFTRRFGAVERAVAGSGATMGEVGLDALEAEWARAKADEH
jgi:MazG family protein